MRILLTTHQFLPQFSGGTEVLTFEVARELRRRRHDVRVLSGWPADTDDDATPRTDRYTYEGIPVHRVRVAAATGLTAAEQVRLAFDDPFPATVLSQIVATWKPDVVHCFHLQRLTASIANRCADLGIPVVYTPTDFWPMCPLNQLRLPDGSACDGPAADAANCIVHLSMVGSHARRARLYRYVPLSAVRGALRAPPALLRGSRRVAAARVVQQRRPFMIDALSRAARILPPTRYMASRLEAFGVDRQRMTVDGYGIDHDGYAELGPATSTGTLTFGFIGTLDASKGAHVLLASLNRLPAALHYDALLFGSESFDPGYAAKLRALASDNAHVRFAGTFERSRLAQVMGRIDVLVVPSLWAENMPLVVLSALTAGRPVVCSDVPGLTETIVHRKNGLVFEAGDADALAALLQELIVDRSSLAALAQGIAPTKDMRTYVDGLVAIYRAGPARHSEA